MINCKNIQHLGNLFFYTYKLIYTLPSICRLLQCIYLYTEVMKFVHKTIGEKTFLSLIIQIFPVTFYFIFPEQKFVSEDKVTAIYFEGLFYTTKAASRILSYQLLRHFSTTKIFQSRQKLRHADTLLTLSKY